MLTTKKSLEHLKKERQITTGMLQPLGMTFEAWLRYAQAPKELQEKCVDLAIKRLTMGE